MNIQSTVNSFYENQLSMNQDISIIFTELSIIVFILICSIFLFYIVQAIYFIYLRKFLGKYSHKTIFLESVLEKYVIRSLIKIVPGILVFNLSGLLTYENIDWSIQISEFVQKISLLYILFHTLKAIFAASDALKVFLKKKEHKQYNIIKSFLQLIKLIVTFLSIILAIAIIVDKSPTILLTGLGALSAVLLLIFKDTILGFVANIQVSAYDTINIGDWITIPSHGADGTVLDISMNVVTVENFDKTIVSIPTGALISNSVKNWKGVFESGGRRIKRSVIIDISSIKFCSPELLNKLKKHNKTKDLLNNEIDDITNIYLFRKYIKQYLYNSPYIHNIGFSTLVRQLQSTQYGVPIEIYAFTTDTNWASYENIQADIFDHIFAIVQIFELKITQLNMISINSKL